MAPDEEFESSSADWGSHMESSVSPWEDGEAVELGDVASDDWEEQDRLALMGAVGS